LELLLHHANSSSLVSTAGSEGEEISVADERDTAYRRRRVLESQANEREKEDEQVEGEEEEEQKKMLKALQVYLATDKDDKLLHAANASRSPMPRWSRASAKSSDDEGKSKMTATVASKFSK
jgi:translation elongation factor EF-G